MRESKKVTTNEVLGIAERALASAKESAKRLDRIEPHAVEEYLDSIEDRVKELSDRLQLEIQKINVVTEVAYFHRNHVGESDQFNATLIKFMDMPTSWWKAKKDKTLSEWVEIVKQEQRT